MQPKADLPVCSARSIQSSLFTIQLNVTMIMSWLSGLCEDASSKGLVNDTLSRLQV